MSEDYGNLETQMGGLDDEDDVKQLSSARRSSTTDPTVVIGYSPGLRQRELTIESVDHHSELTKQLNSYSTIHSAFSYSAYVMSARLRYAYFYFLVTALAFVCMLAFVFTVFFSVLLPEARREEAWGLRAAFMLPFAPIILIGGSLFCDELLDLMIDALSAETMRNFRIRMATLIHVVRNRNQIKVKTAQDPYDGPNPDVWTMRIVDVLVPVILEIVPLLGFIIRAFRYESFGEALSGYFAYGIGIAGSLAAVYVVSHLVSMISNRMIVTERYFDKLTPYRESSWVVPPVSSELKYRILNIGRYLAPGGEDYWKEHRQEQGQSQWQQFKAQYMDRFKLWQRFLMDVFLFVFISALTAYNIIQFALGWFLLCLIMYFMGSKLREKFPKLVGNAFSFFLLFFTISGGFLFIFATAGLQPSSNLGVLPPTTLSAPFPVSVPTTELDDKYTVCRSVWKGLDVVDLGIMANLAYAATNESFHSLMHNAFDNTSMSDWQVVFQQDQSRVIHFKEIFFPSTNLTLITVRGTSTAFEIYQDAYVYGAIGILEIINTFAPIENIIPDSTVQSVIRVLSMPGIAAQPAYQEVVEHVEKLTAEGKNILLTGHSLGGAVAGLTGGRTSNAAVTFSPPGLYYVRKSVGVSEEELRQHLTMIIPHSDVVPAVDEQLGDVQHIECELGAPACHSIDNTVCKLWQKCGDRRQRRWDDYCKDRV